MDHPLMRRRRNFANHRNGLNDLPHGIHRHIISLLSMKDAARTAAVSRYWRTIWHSRPKLEFNYHQFPESENKLADFKRSVDQTLARHDDSVVEAFQLVFWINNDHLFHEPSGENTIRNDWIVFAVAHNVRNLVFWGVFNELTSFPTCLFRCESLVRLNLALVRLTFEFPPNTFLPNLKKMDLKMVELTERSFPDDLSSGCPLLEEMKLSCCCLCRSKVLTISASKLKILTLENCRHIQNCEIRLHSESLHVFVTLGGVAKEYFFSTPNLCYGAANSGEDDESSLSQEELSRYLINLIEKMSSLKQLWFYHRTIEILSHARALWELNASISFVNLSLFEFDLLPALHHVEMAVLIIHRCPNIHCLDIVMRPLEGQITEIPEVESRLETMGWSLDNLSHVKIQNFKAQESEMVLVKFLLDHSPKLLRRRIIKKSPAGVQSEVTLVSDYGEEYVNACAGEAVLVLLTTH